MAHLADNHLARVSGAVDEHTPSSFVPSNLEIQPHRQSQPAHKADEQNAVDEEDRPRVGGLSESVLHQQIEQR